MKNVLMKIKLFFDNNFGVLFFLAASTFGILLIRADRLPIYNFLVLYATFLAIVIYTVETRKLRMVTNDSLYDARFYRIMDMHDKIIEKATNSIFILKTPNNIFHQFFLEFKSKYKPLENYSKEEEQKNINNVIKTLLNGEYSPLHPYIFMIVTLLEFMKDIKRKSLDANLELYHTYFISSIDDYEALFIHYLGISQKIIGDSLDSTQLIKFSINENFLLDSRHTEFYTYYGEDK